METIANLIIAILSGMRAALAPHVNHHTPRTPIFLTAWTRIGRAAARLHNLIALWQSNTLPTSRPARAPRKTPAPKKPYFPAGRAWLAARTDHHVRAHASQLQHLLARPDMADFLTAVPQAARILRPLCHMLGIEPPAQIRPSPRSIRIRPKRIRPRPVPEPVPQGGTPDRPLPAYIRAAVRAWKKKPA